MKKRKLPFNELSVRLCAAPGCLMRIKQRLIESPYNNKFCFEHHKVKEKRRGHPMK